MFNELDNFGIILVDKLVSEINMISYVSNNFSFCAIICLSRPFTLHQDIRNFKKVSGITEIFDF